MSNPIRIASRGSPLALAQAQMVLAQCRVLFPRSEFELKIIKTTGDRLPLASLAASGLPKGLFTKELEQALLAGEADLAVHSLKDLPTEMPPGLVLGAVSARADVRDVLVCRADWAASWTMPQRGGPGGESGGVLARLPQGAVLATSSSRRAAQVKDARPDIAITAMRGNVGTRLRKLATQETLQATILAAAGLVRLGCGWEPAGRLRGPDVPEGLLALPLSTDEMVPCVGQAALGLQVREGDPAMTDLCAGLNHEETQCCVTAERSFLEAMGGGCHLAVAAHALLREGGIHLRAVSFLAGAARRAEGSGTPDDPVGLGRLIAERLRAPGVA